MHEKYDQALGRAQNGQSMANLTSIIAGFTARGIPADDIRPRENILTYDAWRALGRQVKRGEHGVKCFTFIPIPERRDESGEVTRKAGKRPHHTTVFHVSQTEQIERKNHEV